MRLLYLSVILCVQLNAIALDTYTQGRDQFKNGQYREAVKSLDEAIRERPDWFAPYMLQGQCQLKLKEFEPALRQFSEALTLEVPAAYIMGIRYYMGQAYMGMQRYADAGKVFGELAPIAPGKQQSVCYLNQGQCQMQLGKQLMKSDKTKAIGHFLESAGSFGQVLQLKTADKNQKREAVFQRAFARMKLSELEGQVGRMEKGAAELEDYLKTDPEAQRAYRFLIDLDFLIVRKGHDVEARYNQAIQHLDGYLAQWPNEARMLNFKGQAYQGLKRHTEAVAIFEKAIALESDNGKYHFSLGSSLMVSGQHKRALRVFEKTLNLGQRQNPAVYEYLSNCHLAAKSGCFVDDLPLIENAIKALEAGLEAVPGSDQLKKNLERQTHNRSVLMENIQTDNRNHKVALEMVRDLSKTIIGNSNKLQKDTEKYLTTPTQELKANIAKLKAAVTQDEQRLAKEYKTLATYVKEANSCGGAKFFTNYDMMRKVLKTKN